MSLGGTHEANRHHFQYGRRLITNQLCNAAGSQYRLDPISQIHAKGCDYPNPTTSSLPIAYQQSIIDTDTRIKPYNSSDEEQLEHLDETITTYTLNNATAFGKQLSKIEYLSGFEWSHLKLYFANNPQSLRSGFTLPVDKHDINTVTKNDSSGYQVTGEGFTHLTFDKKDNSIACGFGV
ncbi:hypothetical protein PKHYL_39700 [Psychrobacter sp. KH172YL61]|uniref:hypothetical protein n=1 Tax=Psychrobacter sp. KH172YL61 TaxID=2517899 RepID=UPI0010B7A61B|nr:hypothetical protein [Psychrobacter sp. KH172YL61]BBI69779.1 hypothetical protein PKHYL_39700 [Psychrobacter sp. KH172YL61]